MASEAEKARETDPNAPLTAEEAGGETVFDHATLRAVDARLAAKGWKSDVDSAMLANPRIDLRALCPAAFTTPPAPKMVRAAGDLTAGGQFHVDEFRNIVVPRVWFREQDVRAMQLTLDRCDANGMWPAGTTVHAETVPSTPPNGVWMVRDREGVVHGGRESWTEQEARERGRDFDKGWPQDAPHVAVYMVPWEGGR
jgi:hypothetical protein